MKFLIPSVCVGMSVLFGCSDNANFERGRVCADEGWKYFDRHYKGITITFEPRFRYSEKLGTCVGTFGFSDPAAGVEKRELIDLFTNTGITRTMYNPQLTEKEDQRRRDEFEATERSYFP